VVAIRNFKLLQWNSRVYKFIEGFDLVMRDEWLPHDGEAGHDVSEWLLSLPDLGSVMDEPLTSTSNKSKHEKIAQLNTSKECVDI